jgi:RNA polymerase sigma-70 factor, ECF subfamily
MEKEILQRFKAQDKKAFDTLYCQFAPRVLAFAITLTRSRPDAEDLTQEAFLAAFHGAAGFQSRSTMMGWLCGIVVRKFRDKKRTPKSTFTRFSEVVELTEENSPILPRTESFSLTSICLERALETLNDAEREAFVLVAIQGLTQKEAAQVLAIPLGTVKWRVFEASKKLRLVMQEEIEIDGEKGE